MNPLEIYGKSTQDSVGYIAVADNKGLSSFT